METHSVARDYSIAECRVLWPPQGLPQSEQYCSTFASNITGQAPDSATFLESTFRKANMRHKMQLPAG